MSGAALGMVTAMTLAATAPQSSQATVEGFRSGDRRSPAAEQPYVGVAPAVPDASAVPRLACGMPVLHGDSAVDPAFVKPVAKGEGVPVFTMRWVPSVPCDPSLGESADRTVQIPQPRR